MHDAKIPHICWKRSGYKTQSNQPKTFLTPIIDTRSVLESNKKGKKKTLWLVCVSGLF